MLKLKTGTLAFIAALVASVAGAQPQSLPLVHHADVAYAYPFDVPPDDGRNLPAFAVRALPDGSQTLPGSKSSLDYSVTGPMAVDGSTLLYNCHDYARAVARVSIPAKGGASKIIDVCQPIPNMDALNPGDPNNRIVGGALVTGGRVIVSGYAYYDGGGTAVASHWTGDSLAALQGPYALTVKPGFVGGWMNVVPPEWRAALGCPALTGLGGIPIVGRSSHGFSISCFDPAQLGPTPAPARMLIGYPQDHQNFAFGSYDSPGPYFDGSARIAGFAWPSGTRSLLVFERLAAQPGNYCYGQGTNDPTLHRKPVPGTNGAVIYCYDPTDVNGKGTHGYPYKHQIFAYDMADVLAGKQPWEMMPYESWEVPELGAGAAANAQGSTFDPATNRWYLGAGGRTVHVFTISTGAPPPPPPPPPPPTAAIIVNPAVTHQTMRGWEVQDEAAAERPDFLAYRDAAVAGTAAAGINRIRLEIRSGAENPTDSFAAWMAAGFPFGSDPANVAWRAKRYETVNDNADPNVINPAGFHFTEVDRIVNNLANPLRAKLTAQGERLYVSLNYVVALSQITSGAPYIHANAAEYAEFLLATFQHLQATFGWVPDAVELNLEPDNQSAVWTGTYLGQAMVAAGDRLAAAGFHPDFVGPSTVNMTTALTYFDQMMAVPRASTYLKELSYHRYQGVTAASLAAIAAKSKAAGIGSSMLEWWDGGLNADVLHEDLKVGRDAAWQQGPFTNLDSAGSYEITHINPATPTVWEFTNLTKFTSLYFKAARLGAVRIDAVSTKPEFDPLAWRNVDGRFGVVVKASAGGAVTVGGLPAGVYTVSYALSGTNAAGTQPDVTLAAGAVLATTMPGAGVVSIVAKSDAPPPPPDVNCVETAGAWSAWTPNADGLTESRSRVWTQTTPKSGNGTACVWTKDASPATETETRALPPPPPPNVCVTTPLVVTVQAWPGVSEGARSLRYTATVAGAAVQMAELRHIWTAPQRLLVTDTRGCSATVTR